VIPPAPGSAPPPGQAMHALVEQHARDRPHAPALREGGATLDYRTLDRRANAVAQALVRLGVGPGDLVGLCLPRSTAALVAMLGILKAGAAYVAVDPSHPAPWREAVLADARPRYMVGSAHPSTSAADDIEALLAAGAEDEPLPRQADPAGRMYVAYTSGSTGAPKGVVVSHANVARLFPALRPWMAFGPDDIWTLFHSPAFGFSVWEIWGAWCHGGCLVVVPPRLTLAPAALFDLLAAERVTVFSQTPTAFRQLAAELRRGTRHPALPDLRWIAFSGEPLPAQVLAPWLDVFGAERPALANLYALTETSGEVFYHRVTPADLGAPASCIGRPLGDVEACLLKADGEPVADGEVGELWLGGPAIAQGYLNQPGLTAERFTPPPGRGGRWFRTGDLARRQADGTHWFAGRADRQLKHRGYRIEPGAVESALMREPAVLDAVVQLEANGTGGSASLVAYLVLREPGPVPAGLAAHLAARVPHYAVPDLFVAVHALPLTPNGKLDDSALRALAEPARRAGAHGAVAGAEAPDDTQAILASIWAELLELPEVGPEDDFFDRGGHSLLTLHLTIAIEERFGVTVSMTDVFEAPTLRALSAVVRGLRQEPDTPASERLPAAAPAVERGETHGTYMRVAIDEARRALADGQPPYAACIVKDGEVVAVAHNRIWQHTDATAHAEIEAIREACRRLDTIDLQGCVMYSTAEPCSMCLTAGVWAGIGTMVYGADMADEERFGLAKPTVRAATMQQHLDRPLALVPGVGRDEMRALFEQWLRIRALTA
jgi:amino acid adenylation domain-containing protein